MVTDADGRITQNVVYIPYGEVFVEERNGSWASPYLFNAKELDEETGLYYYGARYLNPSIALWLSTDPLQGMYPGMSPYNYCAGNPVKLVDPDGRDVWVIPVIEKTFEILIAGSLIVAYKNYLTKRNEDEKKTTTRIITKVEAKIKIINQLNLHNLQALIHLQERNLKIVTR